MICNYSNELEKESSGILFDESVRHVLFPYEPDSIRSLICSFWLIVQGVSFVLLCVVFMFSYSK